MSISSKCLHGVNQGKLGDRHQRTENAPFSEAKDGASYFIKQGFCARLRLHGKSIDLCKGYNGIHKEK